MDIETFSNIWYERLRNEIRRILERLILLIDTGDADLLTEHVRIRVEKKVAQGQVSSVEACQAEAEKQARRFARSVIQQHIHSQLKVRCESQLNSTWEKVIARLPDWEQGVALLATGAFTDDGEPCSVSDIAKLIQEKADEAEEAEEAVFLRIHMLAIKDIASSIQEIDDEAVNRIRMRAEKHIRKQLRDALFGGFR